MAAIPQCPIQAPQLAIIYNINSQRAPVPPPAPSPLNVLVTYPNPNKMAIENARVNESLVHQHDNFTTEFFWEFLIFFQLTRTTLNLHLWKLATTQLYRRSPSGTLLRHCRGATVASHYE
jgi:hypothetical protein